MTEKAEQDADMPPSSHDGGCPAAGYGLVVSLDFHSRNEPRRYRLEKFYDYKLRDLREAA